MTAAEYRKLVESGKLRPASEQKQTATKRKRLEQTAETTNADNPAYCDLVEIRVEVAEGVYRLHWVRADNSKLISSLQKQIA